MPARSVLLRTPGDVMALRLTVLGIPVRFESNDSRVLALASESFAGGAAVIGRRADDAVVRIVVEGSGPADPSPIRHDVTAGTFTIRSASCTAAIDVAGRHAYAQLTPRLVDDVDRFRDRVLDALTWALLTRLDRAPLHASAIACDDAVLLLHGPSGSGKSTLALAAHAAGMTTVADDIVFVQRRPVRVHTTSSNVHVDYATATRLGIDPRTSHARQRNGVTKYAIPTSDSCDRVFERAGLCVLGARSSRARVRRLDAREVMRHLRFDADPGFDVFAPTIAPALRELVAAGGWLLEPSAQPLEAVPLLSDMLQELATRRRG